jgi:hypothetical protein
MLNHIPSPALEEVCTSDRTVTRRPCKPLLTRVLGVGRAETMASEKAVAKVLDEISREAAK